MLPKMCHPPHGGFFLRTVLAHAAVAVTTTRTSTTRTTTTSVGTSARSCALRVLTNSSNVWCSMRFRSSDQKTHPEHSSPSSSSSATSAQRPNASGSSMPRCPSAAGGAVVDGNRSRIESGGAPSTTGGGGGAGSSGPRRHAGGARGTVSTEQQCRMLQQELQATREELVQVRMALLQAQRQAPKMAEQLLERLTTQDVAAHKAATEMRYTAMALEASMDRLEIDLRRVLSIGLTPEAIDLAAIEAGAKHFVRTNIGFRAEHVSQEPPVAISLQSAEVVTNRTTTTTTVVPLSSTHTLPQK